MRAFEKFKDQLALNILRRAQARVNRNLATERQSRTDKAVDGLRSMIAVDDAQKLDERAALRINQAAALEACNVSPGLVGVICKIASRGAIYSEDMVQIRRLVREANEEAAK